MLRLFVALLLLAAVPALADYTTTPATGPCSCEGVSDAVKAALDSNGYQVKDSSGAPYVDVWLAKSIAMGSQPPGGADFAIPPTTMVGVIRYARGGSDFRGQAIKPGFYVMRFNVQPEDGDHQGASPRRDHLLLSPAADDKDPAAKLAFEAAVDLSRKASGTRHPLVLFLTTPDGSQFPSIKHAGNRDVLQVKSGSAALGIVIAGKAEE